MSKGAFWKTKISSKSYKLSGNGNWGLLKYKHDRWEWQGRYSRVWGVNLNRPGTGEASPRTLFSPEQVCLAGENVQSPSPAPNSILCCCFSSWKIKLDLLCKVVGVTLWESSQPKPAVTFRAMSASLDFASDDAFYLIMFLVTAVKKTRPALAGASRWTSRCQQNAWSALRNSIFWSPDECRIASRTSTDSVSELFTAMCAQATCCS